MKKKIIDASVDILLIMIVLVCDKQEFEGRIVEQIFYNPPFQME